MSHYSEQYVEGLVALNRELVANLELSTRFLEIEAEGHLFRGDAAKAKACEGQAQQNRAVLAKVKV